MPEVILKVNILTTLFMAGLIWVTQVALYPSFLHAAEEGFARNHDKYRLKIALVATLPMVLEAGSAILLLIYTPLWVRPWEVWFGVGLVGIIWASTLFLQVPLHERLSKAFDREAANGLVSTNWIRTVAWSARAALVTVWLWRSLET